VFRQRCIPWESNRTLQGDPAAGSKVTISRTKQSMFHGGGIQILHDELTSPSPSFLDRLQPYRAEVYPPFVPGKGLKRRRESPVNAKSGYRSAELRLSLDGFWVL